MRFEAFRSTMIGLSRQYHKESIPNRELRDIFSSLDMRNSRNVDIASVLTYIMRQTNLPSTVDTESLNRSRMGF